MVGRGKESMGRPIPTGVVSVMLLVCHPTSSLPYTRGATHLQFCGPQAICRDVPAETDVPAVTTDVQASTGTPGIPIHHGVLTRERQPDSSCGRPQQGSHREDEYPVTRPAVPPAQQRPTPPLEADTHCWWAVLHPLARPFRWVTHAPAAPTKT